MISIPLYLLKLNYIIQLCLFFQNGSQWPTLVKSKDLNTAILGNKFYEKTTKLKAKSNLEMQQLYLEEGFKHPFHYVTYYDL